MTAETILAILVAFQPYYGDRTETLAHREARLEPVAHAIWAATDDPELQAGLVSIAWHETRLAAYVTEGHCAEGRHDCDHGKARGPWQVWSWCKATDIDGEAVCAAGLLAYMHHRCGSWASAFGGYGTGGHCVAYGNREATRMAILSKR